MIFGFFYRRRVRKRFEKYRQMLLFNRDAYLGGEITFFIYRQSIISVYEVIDSGFIRDRERTNKDARLLHEYADMSDFLQELLKEKL